MWDYDYENKILQKFRGNINATVVSTLGLVKEAFELRITSNNFMFDIFLVYKSNETHQWNGYQGNRQLFR